MSVKAYRVLSIDLAQPASFDLIEDNKLAEFLKDKYKLLVILDDQGTCLLHVSTEAIQRAVNEAAMNLETQAHLRRDLEYAKEKFMETLQYIVVGG